MAGRGRKEGKSVYKRERTVLGEKGNGYVVERKDGSFETTPRTSSKSFSIVNASTDAPFPESAQLRIFMEMREGLDERTAVEGQGILWSEWCDYRDSNPDFERRCRGNQSGAAAQLQRALLKAATEGLEEVTTETKYSFGDFFKGRWVPILDENGEPITEPIAVGERRVAIKKPPSEKAQDRVLKMLGVEGFADKEKATGNVNIAIITGKEGLSGEEAEALEVRSGSKEVIDVE